MTEEDQPWTFQEVCQAFVAALSLGPVVIVIDGLDEIGNTLGLTIRQVSFHDILITVNTLSTLILRVRMVTAVALSDGFTSL